ALPHARASIMQAIAQYPEHTLLQFPQFYRNEGPLVAELTPQGLATKTSDYLDTNKNSLSANYDINSNKVSLKVSEHRVLLNAYPRKSADDSQ
ncbi:hypothetical protein, partial [Burkholderia sp. SIMBA_019]|uniref:hypothetical protein n=1 Tax=Burkholderia sp. SIMBA_019 TaxID=3085765 RepID=UPI00397A030F